MHQRWSNLDRGSTCFQG